MKAEFKQNRKIIMNESYYPCEKKDAQIISINHIQLTYFYCSTYNKTNPFAKLFHHLSSYDGRTILPLVQTIWQEHTQIIIILYVLRTISESYNCRINKRLDSTAQELITSISVINFFFFCVKIYIIYNQNVFISQVHNLLFFITSILILFIIISKLLHKPIKFNSE